MRVDGELADRSVVVATVLEQKEGDITSPSTTSLQLVEELRVHKESLNPTVH